MSSRCAPIVVLSFNRPQFLGPMLASLAAQPAEQLANREIHLFQDGAINAYSGIRYATDEDIDASIALFRAAFPAGVIHRSPTNIGIFENFRRAETYVFRERAFDCAWFFEDDLILSPVYFEMLERMQAWADEAGSVAYFAAYGNYYAAVSDYEANKRRVIELDHHWAFGLFRRHWEAMQPLMEQFAAVVGGNDYSLRDHRAVFQLFEAHDTATRVSSQDGFKAWVCQALRLWRCNTFLPFGRYIGSTGQHMTPTIFESLGYDKAEIAQEALRLDYPDRAEIERSLDRQAATFREIRSSEYPAIVASLPAQRFTPMRKCTAADVRIGYRLMLGREIADDSLVAEHAGHTSVLDYMSALAASPDFAAPVERRLCTPDDVIYAYRLGIHRDPEEGRVAAHVGRTQAQELMRAIWNGSERQALLAKIVV